MRVLREWVELRTAGLAPEVRASVRRVSYVLAVGIGASVVLFSGWLLAGSPALAAVSASYAVCSLALRGWIAVAPAHAGWVERTMLAVGLGHIAWGAALSGFDQSPLTPFVLVLPVVGASADGRWHAAGWAVACATLLLGLFVGAALAPSLSIVSPPAWMRASGWVLALFTAAVVALAARHNADLLRVELAEARDEALASADARTRFLARMSHEIRTPLHGTLGMTQVLLETPLLAHQKELVDGIRSSGRSLLAIVDQVLDLTKLEADRLDLNPEPFDPVDVVEGVLALFAVPAALSGTRVVAVVVPGLPGWLIGDASRVRQILGNLVSNAVKFTRDGVVCVRVVHRDGALRITVEDTGIGLTEQELARLFRPYKQANRETSIRYGGTGLGLSVAHQLADRMGGHLTASGAPGVGAAFTVILPLAVADPDRPRPLEGMGLAVFDSAEAPSPIVTAGRLLGMDVVRPDPNGLAEVPVDVGWVAVACTEPDPAQVLARARARWPSARFVLLVSMADPASREHAASAGFDAILTEPVRRSALLGLVEGTADPPPAPAIPQDLGGLGVLVVDDNPVNRRVAELMLQRLGASVVSVDSGEAALERVQAQRFDVVIMDVLMPGISGIEATRQLRGLDIPQPRVVTLSASVLEEQREACFEAGVDAFLRKPLTLEALHAVLRDGPRPEGAPGGP